MVLKHIAGEREYTIALKRLNHLISLQPAPGTKEAGELGQLAQVLEDYERNTPPLFEWPAPDPVESILYRMDQTGLKRKDLIPILGSAARVSEVLARKRPLTLAMIRRLHASLGIPAEILIQPIKLARKRSA
ncbi:MAG: transcriptional regulator [bacterium]